MTAMARKIAAEYASCVPGIGTTPIFVNDKGNPVIVRGANRISAMPRYRVRVPMVTAIEGSPTLATSTPLSAPPSAPTTSAAAIANQIGHPLLNSSPMTAPDRPSIEATDRSISPVMMIRVSGSAMMAISPMFRPV
jgi:hypothetical protein